MCGGYIVSIRDPKGLGDFMVIVILILIAGVIVALL